MMEISKGDLVHAIIHITEIGVLIWIALRAHYTASDVSLTIEDVLIECENPEQQIYKITVVVEVKNAAISQFPVTIRDDMVTYLSVTEEEIERYPNLRLRKKKFDNTWVMVREPFGGGGAGLPKHLKPGEYLYLNWTFYYASVLPGEHTLYIEFFYEDTQLRIKELKEEIRITEFGGYSLSHP